MINKDTIIGKEDNGDNISLGNLQELLTILLKDIVEVLENNNIFYFAAEGTMLGAIRHSGMIPWDDDVDLGFKLQDYNKIVEILKNNLNEKYEVQCFDTNNNYAVTQPIIKVRIKNTYVEYNAWYDRNNCGCNGVFVDLIGFSNCCPTNKDYIKRKIALIRTIALLCFNYLNINVRLFKKRHLNIAFDYDKKYSNSSFVGYALNYMPWRKFMFHKEDFDSLIDVKFNNFSIKVPSGYDRILTSLYGNYMEIPKDIDIKLMHSKNVKLKYYKNN